jgi:hypothetical protein
MISQEQIQKLEPKQSDLLTISVPLPLKQEQRERLEANLRPLVQRMGCELIVLEAGITAQLQPNMADLLAEQQKQTALLEQIATGQLALIEALADDEGEDPDAPPRTYLDGTPCR